MPGQAYRAKAGPRFARLEHAKSQGQGALPRPARSRSVRGRRTACWLRAMRRSRQGRKRWRNRQEAPAYQSAPAGNALFGLRPSGSTSSRRGGGPAEVPCAPCAIHEAPAAVSGYLLMCAAWGIWPSVVGSFHGPGAGRTPLATVASHVRRRGASYARSGSRHAWATVTPRSVTSFTGAILNAWLDFRVVMSSPQVPGHDAVSGPTKPAAAHLPFFKHA